MAHGDLAGRNQGIQPECCPYCFVGFGELMRVAGHQLEVTLGGVLNTVCPGPNWSAFDGVHVLDCTFLENLECGCLRNYYLKEFNGSWTLDDGTTTTAVYSIYCVLQPRDEPRTTTLDTKWRSVTLVLTVTASTFQSWSVSLDYDWACDPYDATNETIGATDYADPRPTVALRLISG